MDSYSRRDFLKLSGFGLLSLVLPFGKTSPHQPLKTLLDDFPPDQQGRVTSVILWVYDKPSFSGNRVKMYWRDLLLPLTNVTISEDDQNAHNRVWYEVGTEGFAHSASLQPVRTLLNPP